MRKFDYENEIEGEPTFSFNWPDALIILGFALIFAGILMKIL